MSADPLTGTPFEAVEEPPAQVPLPMMILPMQGLEVNENGPIVPGVGPTTELTMTSPYGIRAGVTANDATLAALVERFQGILRTHKGAGLVGPPAGGLVAVDGSALTS